MTRIKEHVEKIAKGEHEKVRPGMPQAFNGAHTVEDCGSQGDLDITIIDKVPTGYKLVEKIEEKHLQLVPGNHIGARHCLDTTKGYKMYLPEATMTEESLEGPVLVLDADADVTVVHPTHGNVKLFGGQSYQVTYQRNWDTEKKKERRSLD